MNILVLDCETKVSHYGQKSDEIDNSPFNPENELVSVNWRKIENGVIGPDNHSVFYHNDQPIPDGPEVLQQALDWSTMIVAHNAKYDVLWLTESGFRLPEKVYCTMIGEYILARGVHTELSLKSTAIRRNVTNKKSDLTEEYWSDGIGFEEMPLPVVLEYADADVLSCAEIFLQQQADWAKDENRTLTNIVSLMNDMLMFLVEIERNGICINTEKLAEVKAQYEAELIQIEKTLNDIVAEVMGDTPINLNSGADITKVVFSREVKDRSAHVLKFNIGVNAKGKKLNPPNMSPSQFREAVRETTKVVYRTTAEHCHRCNGTGIIRKIKKDGTLFKKDNKCYACGGAGMLYIPTNKVAGLKLLPRNAESASVNGFSCAKDDIDYLLDQAYTAGNETAVLFLKTKKRLNAVSVYLNSFVTGIERWTRDNDLLHANFNQCVARTGRLSSSDPNFQNQPKGKKFPIRKTVKSRFEGGKIMECDFSGLEFTVAGELSRDPVIIHDILSGKDIHAQTATIVFEVPEGVVINWKDGGENEDKRSSIKPDTFAPLYGATGMGKPPHIKKYYQEFFNIYKRHGEWQIEQMDAVMQRGFVRTPSGREYRFPGTKRIGNHRTTNATNIVNYPVQGFATGDIVPLACIRALRLFKRFNLKSVLILTVHDSIVADVHPDEIRIVHDLLKLATEGCVSEIKTLWNYDMALPLRAEVQFGNSWGDLEHIHPEQFAYNNDNYELMLKEIA